MLYSFGSIVWGARGFSGLDIGIFWAIGVCCEITLFSMSGAAIRTFGPTGLLALGGIGAIIRWVWFAQQPGFLGFALGQSLHGLTFCATYLGNQHAIARAVPERLTSSAQGVFAMVSGLLMAGTTALSGPLYEHLGARTYLAMTVPAGLGLLMLGGYWVVAMIEGRRAA